MASGDSEPLRFGFRLPSALPEPMSDDPELAGHLACWSECRWGPAMASANARLLCDPEPRDLAHLLPLLTPAVLDLGDNVYREEVYRTLSPREQHAYARAADDVTEAQRKRRFLIQALFRALALHGEGEQKLIALLSPRVADHLRDQVARALLRSPTVPPLPEASPCSEAALEGVAGLIGESEPHLVARATAAIIALGPEDAFDRISPVLPDPDKPSAAALARFNELVFALPDDGSLTDRRWVRAILPLMRFSYHADIALERLGASESKVAAKRADIGPILAPGTGDSVSPPPRERVRPSGPPPPPTPVPAEVDPVEQRAALEGVLRAARLLSKGRPLIAPAIRLFPTRAADGFTPPVGSTYFGGAPDLGVGEEWPACDDGRPMTFIGQIALEDVAPHDADGQLPKHGLVSFFVDASFDEGDAAGYLACSRVIHATDRQGLARAEVPPAEVPRPICTLQFRLQLMLPPPDHPAVRSALDEKQRGRYVAKVHRPPPEGHQLLGYRDRVSTEPPPAGSRLLFQCTTDPVAGTHWGDAVHLDFWIEEEALASREIHRAVTEHGRG